MARAGKIHDRKMIIQYQYDGNYQVALMDVFIQYSCKMYGIAYSDPLKAKRIKELRILIPI
ncbi:MAG: hypothetical protein LBL79_06830 [Prevotella sp.]|jgi:hypothetical protein|nr:hypothetical protein [Prevotella sp.]